MIITIGLIENHIHNEDLLGIKHGNSQSITPAEATGIDAAERTEVADLRTPGLIL